MQYPDIVPHLIPVPQPKDLPLQYPAPFIISTLFDGLQNRVCLLFFFPVCSFPSSGLPSIHVLLMWHLTTYINQMSVWLKPDVYQFWETEQDEKKSEFFNRWWSHKQSSLKCMCTENSNSTTALIDLCATYLFEWIMEFQHLFMAFAIIEGRICSDQGNRESKTAGKWHFSEVVGIFSPSWVTAKCDYLSCAGRVQPLHRPAFIRCCLLWWCFADVLDHTLQCSLSSAFCHPPPHFGSDALDFSCNNIQS